MRPPDGRNFQEDGLNPRIQLPDLEKKFWQKSFHESHQAVKRQKKNKLPH